MTPLPPGGSAAPDEARPPTVRSIFSLRSKLLFMLAGIILFILVGQTLISLSGEVTALDHHVATEGTVLAQSVASSAAALWTSDNPRRFDPLIDRVTEAVDLIELAIVAEGGQILAHSDASRVGDWMSQRPKNVFGAPRAGPGLTGLFKPEAEYGVSAPILGGTEVLGYVHLRFRSAEVSDRAGRLLGSAAAMGLFWLAIAAIIGTFWVRRVTRPLASLTRAASDVIEGRLDKVSLKATQASSKVRDEVGTLEATFVHLVDALRGKQDENDRLLGELHHANETLRQRVDEVTADLRETSAYLESVLGSMNEGVITCDDDLTVVQFNPSAQRQLGGLGSLKQGATLASIIPDGAALQAAVEQVIALGEPATIELARSQAAPGLEPTAAVDGAAGVRILVFRIDRLRRGGEAQGAVLTVLDETDKRMVEARLRRRDRLVSLGTIAAGLAHELGNYMHAINGFSSLLMRSIPEGDPRRPDIESIYAENGRAIGLLERFLLFARPETFAFQHEDLDGLVREAISMTAYKARKANVRVDDRLALEGVPVRCDARLIIQAFTNLALNAIDAMHNGAERSLTLVSRALPDDRVEVALQDTGTGIAPEHVDRIFDPFFTTKDADGTGLGLSIVHQVVTRHGGSVTVDSQPGEGTTFTVVLPISGPKGVEA